MQYLMPLMLNAVRPSESRPRPATTAASAAAAHRGARARARVLPEFGCGTALQRSLGSTGAAVPADARRLREGNAGAAMDATRGDGEVKGRPRRGWSPPPRGGIGAAGASRALDESR